VASCTPPALQLEQLPVVGDLVRRRAGDLPQARRGVAASDYEAESFVAPLAVPRVPPGRLYFVFQKPIQTSPEDLKVSAGSPRTVCSKSSASSVCAASKPALL
jgi:hypothetical protein